MKLSEGKALHGWAGCWTSGTPIGKWGSSQSTRKYSVVAFRHFGSGKIAHFIVIGPSFGLASAVYNDNRSSVLLDEILINVFGLVSFNFYDDKFGFETSESIDSAMLVASSVHTWLAAKFDTKKLQQGPVVDILGSLTIWSI